MDQLTRIAIDTSKVVFTLHGVGQKREKVLQRDLQRHQVEPFFAKLPLLQVARQTDRADAEAISEAAARHS